MAWAWWRLNCWLEISWFWHLVSCWETCCLNQGRTHRWVSHRSGGFTCLSCFWLQSTTLYRRETDKKACSIFYHQSSMIGRYMWNMRRVATFVSYTSSSTCLFASSRRLYPKIAMGRQTYSFSKILQQLNLCTNSLTHNWWMNRYCQINQPEWSSTVGSLTPCVDLQNIPSHCTPGSRPAVRVFPERMAKHLPAGAAQACTGGRQDWQRFRSKDLAKIDFPVINPVANEPGSDSDHY